MVQLDLINTKNITEVERLKNLRKKYYKELQKKLDINTQHKITLIMSYNNVFKDIDEKILKEKQKENNTKPNVKEQNIVKNNLSNF